MTITPDSVPAEGLRLAVSKAAQGAKLLASSCHMIAANGGWWHDPETGEKISLEAGTRERKLLLIHSELSEAVEGLRKDLADDKLPQHSMYSVELIDTVIRLFDLLGAEDFDPAEIIRDKLAFNIQRADHKPEARKASNGKKW